MCILHTFFSLIVFDYFPLFVVLPVAAPAGGHGSDATTARFILSLFSPLASLRLLFAFCPSVFSINFFFIQFSYAHNYYFFASFSAARVSHDHEAKLNRVPQIRYSWHPREWRGGGLAVVGKPRLTKAGRRRQTG